MTKIVAFAAALMVVSIAGVTSASADAAKSRSAITACSKNGHHTCYTAAVGEGRYGPKLRLKHGTYIDCEGDCRDTLRRATVDFWDDRRENY